MRFADFQRLGADEVYSVSLFLFAVEVHDGGYYPLAVTVGVDKNRYVFLPVSPPEHVGDKWRNPGEVRGDVVFVLPGHAELKPDVSFFIDMARGLHCVEIQSLHIRGKRF